MTDLGDSGQPVDLSEQPSDLVELLSRKVVGQEAAMRFIVPYVQMYQAGLAPPGRPAGIFLLLGPTGTGKTRTVEALAEILHGAQRAILKVDCGEYQADHEVAKLIGAPPGYLGHRETRPVLSQPRLDEVTSDRCHLSLVLFDEIEKAAPSLSVLLLGILDKAALRLGDGTEVDFENSLIFLTSNLGAREMLAELRPKLGFQAADPPSGTELVQRLESIGLAAIRKRFSPEFVNRIDVVVTYQPLDEQALIAILDQQIEELRAHVNTRLGPRSFEIAVGEEARRFLLDRGTSSEYGARELKRTIHRYLTQPLAVSVAEHQIPPGAEVRVQLSEERDRLAFDVAAGRDEAQVPVSPVVLVVDDNGTLLDWFRKTLTKQGFEVYGASSVEDGMEASARHAPDALIADFILPDGDGVSLALALQRERPELQVIVMSGLELPEDESEICRRHGFPVLVKPFLGGDVVRLLRASLRHGTSGSRAAL